MTSFNAKAIQSALSQGQVLIFDEIDSTNEYLLNHCHALSCGSLCLAETQTSGRGRRGRRWYSPQSQNLYFSMLWHYPHAQIPQLSALSLRVSLLIVECLQKLKVPQLNIKWPNDIYYQGKKMGGILIESKIDKNGLYLVIGIGLNLGMTQVDENVVTQAWSDLSHYKPDRNQLSIALAQSLQQALSTYPQTGFAPYAERWQQFDLFVHQNVKVMTETDTLYGVSLGITEEGELILQQGEIIRYFGMGEVSLKADSV